MRPLRFVWLLTLLAAVPAAGQDPSAEIRAADARRMAAMVAVDVPALEGLLADELTYTHSSGVVETRAQFLANLTAGKLRYRSMTPSEVSVRAYGEVAVATGKADVNVTSEGTDLALALRFTEVWVKREGAWKLAVWQSTRVP
jgi:ketosteroid isomerase-like protein